MGEGGQGGRHRAGVARQITYKNQTLKTLLLIYAFPAPALTAEPASFPHRPVRWVVPYPTGDRIGVQSVIAAPADGYTQLLALNTNYTIDRSLFKNLGYDPEIALLPVTIVATTSQLLITNTAFPPKAARRRHWRPACIKT